MKHAAPQQQRKAGKPAARRPGPAPARKAAMGRPFGLNHVEIGPVENGSESQAHDAASRVLRGERGVARDLTPAPPAAVAVPSRGHPLPQVHRAWLEPAFGADLGSVRVHHDNEAATAARAEHALAFTAGRDIYFGKGSYDPSCEQGQHLLAHEVAHVLQQTAVTGPGNRRHATDAAGSGEVQRAAVSGKKEDKATSPAVRATPAAAQVPTGYSPVMTGRAAAPASNAMSTYDPAATAARPTGLSGPVHDATTRASRPRSPAETDVLGSRRRGPA